LKITNCQGNGCRLPGLIYFKGYGLWVSSNEQWVIKFEIRNPGETEKKTQVSQGRQIRMEKIQMIKTKG
jgi:hypothetical protein